MPLANYCLSLSYDYATKTTTAFIHGAYLHATLPTMCLSILSKPLLDNPRRRHRDYGGSRVQNNATQTTQSSHLISRLQSSITHWGHPVLLPILLLQNYLSRSNLFAWDLDDKVVALERQTGVVFAGRTGNSYDMNIDPGKILRDKIRTLTKDMHSLLTQIIFFERVVTWVLECTAFLEKTAKESQRDGVEVEGRANSDWRRENRNVLEMIESLAAVASGLCGFQKSLKERVQSQINILYSFNAQIDNSINARIAVSSARDSSAMKSLALITIIFLPGTYVAALFSMSMFSWSQSSSGISSSNPDGTTVVSQSFWIYWAVTIPLTILIIIIWRAWWVWQEQSYQNDVKEAVGTVGNDDALNSSDNIGHTLIEEANGRTKLYHL